MYERARLWQHLANAGLINGSFTGLQSTFAFEPGSSYPKGPLNSYWGVQANNDDDMGSYNQQAPFQFPSVPFGNYLYFFNSDSTIFDVSGAFGKLVPSEAWNIDKKIDDGMPATGALLGGRANFMVCFCYDPLTGAYDLDSQNEICALAFRL